MVIFHSKPLVMARGYHHFDGLYPGYRPINHQISQPHRRARMSCDARPRATCLSATWPSSMRFLRLCGGEGWEGRGMDMSWPMLGQLHSTNTGSWEGHINYSWPMIICRQSWYELTHVDEGHINSTAMTSWAIWVKLFWFFWTVGRFGLWM